MRVAATVVGVLPNGVLEPACSAHHVSAIVEGAAGPEGRFTPADVSNLLNGRHSSALLERIPHGVEVFVVFAGETGTAVVTVETRSVGPSVNP